MIFNEGVTQQEVRDRLPQIIKGINKGTFWEMLKQAGTKVYSLPTENHTTNGFGLFIEPSKPIDGFSAAFCRQWKSLGEKPFLGFDIFFLEDQIPHPTIQRIKDGLQKIDPSNNVYAYYINKSAVMHVSYGSFMSKNGKLLPSYLIKGKPSQGILFHHIDSVKDMDPEIKYVNFDLDLRRGETFGLLSSQVYPELQGVKANDIPPTELKNQFRIERMEVGNGVGLEYSYPIRYPERNSGLKRLVVPQRITIQA